jgi:hypothetical protein
MWSEGDRKGPHSTQPHPHPYNDYDEGERLALALCALIYSTNTDMSVKGDVYGLFFMRH